MTIIFDKNDLRKGAKNKEVCELSSKDFRGDLLATILRSNNVIYYESPMEYTILKCRNGIAKHRPIGELMQDLNAILHESY